MTQANPKTTLDVVSRTLTIDEDGMLMAAGPGGVNPLIYTLPPAYNSGELRFAHYMGVDSVIRIVPDGAEHIIFNATDSCSAIWTHERGAIIRLLAIPGIGWGVVDGIGDWYSADDEEPRPVTTGDDGKRIARGETWVREVCCLNLTSDAAQAGAPPAGALVGEVWVANTWGVPYIDGKLYQCTGVGPVTWSAALVKQSSLPGAGVVPDKGTRCIVRGATGGGAAGTFTGYENYIAECNGYGWFFFTPQPHGAEVFVGTLDTSYGTKLWGYFPDLGPTRAHWDPAVPGVVVTDAATSALARVDGDNTVTAGSSTLTLGVEGEVQDDYATTLGYLAAARWKGAVGQASGNYGGHLGDPGAQGSEVMVMYQFTDGAVSKAMDPAGLLLPLEGALLLRGLVVAKHTGVLVAEAVMWAFEAAVIGPTSGPAAAYLLGSNKDRMFETAEDAEATWDITLSVDADGADYRFNITVTGGAADQIGWTARIESAEVVGYSLPA